MHPAKSVIAFTTAAGAGYGLLIWLALFCAVGALPPGRGLGLAACGLALALVAGGLLASTAHLGRPERAWRAMSQWRSSWLSREGLAALVTFLPAGLFALGWVVFGANGGAWAVLGILAAVGGVVTLYATAMIYASLRTVRAWHNGWTVPSYLAFALMSGGLILHALTRLWGLDAAPAAGLVALAATAVAFAVKAGYWHFLASGRSESDSGTATGLSAFGTVRLLEAPHTEANYLMKEMGYRIARKHAARLRVVVWSAAFAVPAVATLLALLVPGPFAALLAIVAVLSAGVGILVERWLFFAEAKHVVTLYYGAVTA